MKVKRTIKWSMKHHSFSICWVFLLLVYAFHITEILQSISTLNNSVLSIKLNTKGQLPIWFRNSRSVIILSLKLFVPFILLMFFQSLKPFVYGYRYCLFKVKAQAFLLSAEEKPMKLILAQGKQLRLLFETKFEQAHQHSAHARGKIAAQPPWKSRGDWASL